MVICTARFMNIKNIDYIHITLPYHRLTHSHVVHCSIHSRPTYILNKCIPSLLPQFNSLPFLFVIFYVNIIISEMISIKNGIATDINCTTKDGVEQSRTRVEKTEREDPIYYLRECAFLTCH